VTKTLYYTDKAGTQWIERYQVSLDLDQYPDVVHYIVEDLDNDSKRVSRRYVRGDAAYRKAIAMNLKEREGSK
jgi:hypothetical protein